MNIQELFRLFFLFWYILFFFNFFYSSDVQPPEAVPLESNKLTEVNCQSLAVQSGVLPGLLGTGSAIPSALYSSVHFILPDPYFFIISREVPFSFFSFWNYNC